MLKSLILSSLLILTLSNLLRSQPRWESNLIYDRIIRDLYSANNNLYALTDYGVYFSTDKGNFWSCMKINEGNANLDCYAITNIENQIFLGTSYFGIYSTTNHGITWSVLNNGLGGASIFRLLAKGSFLFAGSNDNGIFISTNRGVSWTGSDSGLTNLQIRSLIADQNNVYTGTTAGGVFLSTDNGISWNSRNSGLPSSPVLSLFINNGNLYAGFGNGRIYRTSNSGQNWISRSIGLGPGAVKGFSTSGDFIFVGTNSGIYKTSNSGANWSPVNSGLGANPQVNSLITLDSKLFAGLESVQKGVYFSTNLGDNWSEQNSGLTNGRLNCLNGNGNSIYTSDWIFGTTIYKTVDNGSNWTNTGSVYSLGLLTSIVFKSSFIFAATSGDGIYRSSESAFNWKRISPTNIPSNMNKLIVKDNFIFAVSADNGIYRSSDDGNSWISVNEGLTNYYIKDISLSGNNLVAGSEGGIFYTSDNGINWHKSSDNNTQSLFSIGSITYSSGINGLFVSGNNGLTWEERDSTLNFTEISGNENLLFGSSHYSGILVSNDKGFKWRNYSIGFLSTPDIAEFYINNDFIFASTAYNGVYRLNLSEFVGLNSLSQKVPEDYFLFQNYPNPFNPYTKIKFELHKNSFVRLKIYDALGREIQTLVEKSLIPGVYTSDFDGSQISSGVYFYKIEINNIENGELLYTSSNRMILLK